MFGSVHQSDRKYLQMFTIYIAKATANFGLPATRPIYERALEGSFFFYRVEFTSDIIPVLPDRQTAEICLRFATLERKLGEIDRARAIYAHASQFCDPRVNPHFWSEWNSFEIETGSEDTFREMLRIKRSVQAQFNTEASYLAAQTITARQGTQKAVQNNEPQDAMTTAEKQVYGGTNGPAFISAKTTDNAPPAGKDNGMDVSSPRANNADEIQISDDEE